MKLFRFMVVMGFIGVASLAAALDNPIGLATNSEINARYIQVRNSDNVTHEVGDVVVYVDGTNDGIDITTTTTANNALVAGVVAVKDIAAGAYGLVQVYGLNTSVATDGNVTAGQALVTSTTGEVCTSYTVAMATGTLTGEAISPGVFGVALATDTGTVAPVILRIN